MVLCVGVTLRLPRAVTSPMPVIVVVVGFSTAQISMADGPRWLRFRGAWFRRRGRSLCQSAHNGQGEDGSVQKFHGASMNPNQYIRYGLNARSANADVRVC